MRVLFLSAWYPTERDKMSGLFVAKHKEAVERQGVDVRVVYTEEKGLGYWQSMRKQLKALWQEGWKPDVVQLNVITKNALIALYLKKRYHIPYIIVEHWSGYLPENGDYQRMGMLHHLIARLTVKNATEVFTVSRILGEQMQRQGLRHPHYSIIPNVVDDFFYSAPSPENRAIGSPKRLLYVGCFDEKAKNVKGMLRALKLLSEQRQDWHLVIIGTGVDRSECQEYASAIGLPDKLHTWLGEQRPDQVSEWMHHTDALILFSRYETFGVVAAESLAAGVPVVSSKAGAIPEIVDDACGILTPVEDEKAFASALNQMLDSSESYDKEYIRQKGQQYSYSHVGQQLKRAYEASIKNAPHT